MKLTIYQDKSLEWRWRLRAANGRTIADSGEGYKTKNGVIRAVEMFSGVIEGSPLQVPVLLALDSLKGGTP